MRKGELWLAELDPTQDKEQTGTRPVVIVSGNAMNDNTELVIICPLTTKIKNFIGDIILDTGQENGLEQRSEILIFQIRAISKYRLLKKIGAVTSTESEKIIENLNKILKY